MVFTRTNILRKGQPYIEFNGVNTFINCGHGASLANLSSTPPFTVEAWVKLPSKPVSSLHTGTIFEKQNNIDYAGFVSYFQPIEYDDDNEAYTEFSVWGNDGTASSFFPFENLPSNWIHYNCYLHTNFKSVISVNGMWGVYRETHSVIDPSDDSAINFLLGGSLYYNKFLEGLMGWVRISTTDRYGGATLTNFTPPSRYIIPEPDANTKLLLPMNEGHGKIVHDLSGNGNHGTITNGVWRF